MSSIRSRILLIVVTMAAGLVLLGILAVLQVTKLATESSAAIHRLTSVVELVDSARSAQHHFKVQIQEWKNILSVAATRPSTTNT